MRRTTTLSEYRSSSLRVPRQSAMTWAMIGGIITGVALPLLLVAFITLSPIVSLIAYIGLAVCPFLFPALAASVVALKYLFKAARQAKQKNSAPDAPDPVRQQQPQQQGHPLGGNDTVWLLARIYVEGHDNFDPSEHDFVDVPRSNKDDEVPLPYQEAQQNDRPTTYQRLIRLQEEPYNVDIKNGIQDPNDATKRINDHPEFFCPISQEVMKHPVLAHDGAHYDKSWIEAHMENSSKKVNGLGWKSPATNVWIAKSSDIKAWVDNTKEQYSIEDYPFDLMEDQSLIYAMDKYADTKEAEFGTTSEPLMSTPATVPSSPPPTAAGQADHSQDQSPHWDYPKM